MCFVVGKPELENLIVFSAQRFSRANECFVQKAVEDRKEREI